MEHGPLLTARTTSILASLVAITCACVAVPIAAFGGEDARSEAASAAVEQALEVRAEVNAVNEQAREDAPAAVGNRCDRTLDVEGIGDTCVTEDGLLRVEQADGRSHTIHGMDAPPVGANSFAPTSQAAVTGADVSDVTCVGADRPHYVLVYARPGNVASRYTTVAPLLRTELYKVSAFIDAETRAVSPGQSKRVPVLCEGGEPIVQQATLAGLTSGTASFSQVVDGFRALGYEFNGDRSGNQRYIVYWDSPSPSGAAGTGHVFTTDSSVGASNQNNKGGLYAIEYRFADGGGAPHWEVLIHEVVHTMGAVVNDAANSSAAGHCTDGQDIMCYQDTASTSYNPSVCGTKVLDCGRNDYFNPAPAAGSFLATHWNTAATYNRFLDHGAATDASAPTTVAGLTQTGASSSAIGVGWSAAGDDSGSTSYVVSIRLPGAAWTTALTTARRSAALTGLTASTSYEVGVAARDAAGNVSAPTVIAAATNDQLDGTAPGMPSGLSVRQSASKVTFSWNDASDDVGVARYELRVLTPVASDPSRRVLRSAGSTTETTISVPISRLRRGVAYQYELVARDGASNVSAGVRVKVTVPRDRMRPTLPTRARVQASSRTSLSLSWSPSRDNVAVRGYVVSQLVGRRWARLTTVGASTRLVRVTRLRAATSYSFRVTAIDSSGNQSLPAAVRGRTR